MVAMLQFTAIDIVGDELELLQLAGNILQARLFDETDQKKFMVQVHVSGQPSRMPVARDQMIGKSGLTTKPPSEFSVLVSLFGGLADAVDMLAHELIHISQLRSGRLKVHAKTKKIDGVKQRVHFAKWGKAKPVMIDTLAYAERGWEQEAYQWQTQLRMDAIALMLGAPHHIHVQSAKGELALFEAKGPLPPSSAAPAPAPQDQMAPSAPFAPPPLQQAGVRPQMAMQQAASFAPPQHAAVPPTQPAMPVMQQSAPQLDAGMSSPVTGQPAQMPSMGHEMVNMQVPQQAAQPAEVTPAMPMDPAPTIMPVMARAVARPATPTTSEMPAMPDVPVPAEPTSFKPIEDYAAKAEKEASPESASSPVEADLTGDIGIDEIQPDIGTNALLDDAENMSTTLADDDLLTEVDITSGGGIDADDGTEADDSMLEPHDEDASNVETEIAVLDETEPFEPAASLPEAALDDDVLAALMADDAADQLPDVSATDEMASASVDSSLNDGNEAAAEDEAGLVKFDDAEITADSIAEDDIDTGINLDAAILDASMGSGTTESETISGETSTDSEQNFAPASLDIQKDVKDDTILPTETTAISPDTTSSIPEADPPKYDAFGSAPDLTALNAVATDADKAFAQPRFVDVDGVGEARQLNEGAVDSKLKDLQARGLADVDVSRAIRSEELS